MEPAPGAQNLWLPHNPTFLGWASLGPVLYGLFSCPTPQPASPTLSLPVTSVTLHLQRGLATSLGRIGIRHTPCGILGIAAAIPIPGEICLG